MTYHSAFAQVAWLLYDKTDQKLQFITALEGSEPNEKRFEKLLGYMVDK